MARVLIVEDSRTQARAFQLLVEGAGYEVAQADNGREALAAIAACPPDVVLTDLDMPEMNGLELVEAVRRDYPGVPVVLMTAVGNEEIAVEALRKGAASYVTKKNLPRDIGPTLESVLMVARASRQENRVLDCMTHASFRFLLDNDVSLVGPLIGHLEATGMRLRRSDRTELVRVGIALHEALVNAIQHGNLEVSSELRQGPGEDRFYETVEARRHQPPYSERRVHLHAELSSTETVYVVSDEGPGYDPSSLPDPTDPANLERIGGRGLMLIRTFMDRVEFSDRGNRITLTKRHSPAS